MPWKRAFHRYPPARSGAAFALNKAHNRTKVDSPLVCHQTCSSPQQSPAATIMGGRSRQRQEKPVMGCPADAGIDRSSINRQLPTKRPRKATHDCPQEGERPPSRRLFLLLAARPSDDGLREAWQPGSRRIEVEKAFNRRMGGRIPATRFVRCLCIVIRRAYASAAAHDPPVGLICRRRGCHPPRATLPPR